jgi:hypothetical protein
LTRCVAVMYGARWINEGRIPATVGNPKPFDASADNAVNHSDS